MNNVVEIENNKPLKPTPAGSGSGGGDLSLERRVGNLEIDIKDVKKSLQSIEITLARIEGDLKTKASAVEVAEIKGQLKNMPSTWQLIVIFMSSMIGVAGFVFAIVKFVK